jgi:hypothetical protein
MWCPPSLNPGKDLGFQKLGLATKPKKFWTFLATEHISQWMN